MNGPALNRPARSLCATTTYRSLSLRLYRFLKDNIAVIGRDPFLGIVRIAHNRDTVDHRRLLSERLLVIFVNIPFFVDPHAHFLSAALDDHHLGEIGIGIIDDRADRRLCFPDIVQGGDWDIAEPSLSGFELEL